MSTPPTKQLFVIDGDLQITTKPSADGSTLGRVVFQDTVAGEIGALKVFGGGPGYYRLILDTTKIQRGISFRTFPGQGAPQEGGQNYAYTMDVQNSYIGLNNYTVIKPLQARYPTGEFPGNLLNIQKTSSPSWSQDDTMISCTMATFQPNQSLTIDVGQQAAYSACLGYKNPVGGSATSNQSYGYLGHKFVIECLRFFRDGNVSIPLQLTVVRLMPPPTKIYHPYLHLSCCH